MTKSGSRETANAEYLTPQEVAERLRVTRRTVYNWITDGRLGADKAGPKLWRVTPVQLQQFQAQERAASVPTVRAGFSASSGPPRRPLPEPLPVRPAPKPSAGPVPPSSFSVPGVSSGDETAGRAQGGARSGGGSSLKPAAIGGKKKAGGRRR